MTDFIIALSNSEILVSGSGLCPKHLLFLFGFFSSPTTSASSSSPDRLSTKTHTCKLHMNLKLGMYLEHNK